MILILNSKVSNLLFKNLILQSKVLLKTFTTKNITNTSSIIQAQINNGSSVDIINVSSNNGYKKVQTFIKLSLAIIILYIFIVTS